jgi:hypothetical protein
MTERDATEAIFQKLCEEFKLNGREWETAFTLGGELGLLKTKFETLCGFLGRMVNIVSK